MLLRLVPLLGILAVNLIPLAGVIWFGWSVFEVLLLYWIENVAIGVMHAARMAISTRTNEVENGLSTTMFFCLHYGMFTLVHGVFVITLFGVVGGGIKELSGGLLGPSLAIFAWQVVSLCLDAARTEYFKGRRPDDLLFEPYPRVLALHLTVIAGGWFVSELGQPIWALVILVGVKMLCDLGIAAVSSMFSGSGESVGATMRALRKPRD